MHGLAYNGDVVAFKMAAGKAVRAGLAVGGRIPLQFFLLPFSSLTFSKKTGVGSNRRIPLESPCRKEKLDHGEQ